MQWLLPYGIASALPLLECGKMRRPSRPRSAWHCNCLHQMSLGRCVAQFQEQEQIESAIVCCGAKSASHSMPFQITKAIGLEPKIGPWLAACHPSPFASVKNRSAHASQNHEMSDTSESPVRPERADERNLGDKLSTSTRGWMPRNPRGSGEQTEMCRDIPFDRTFPQIRRLLCSLRLY